MIQFTIPGQALYLQFYYCSIQVQSMIHTLHYAQGYLIFRHHLEPSLAVFLPVCLEVTSGFSPKYHE